MNSLIRAIGFLMFFFAIIIAIWSWRLIAMPELIQSEAWVHHLINYPIAMYLHFIFGPLSLALMGFQFLKNFRQMKPLIHKRIGYIYIASCLLAAFSAIPLALNTKEGPIAALGLLTLALVWIVFICLATRAIFNSNFKLHERYMYRAAALTFAGVTLRLYLIIAVSVLDISYQVAYPIISWLCWLSPLIAVEIYIQKKLNKSSV